MKKLEEIFTYGPYKDVQFLSDGILRAKDGGSFHIHKVILTTQSEYFRAMFKFDVDRKDFLLKNIDKSTLEEILVFIYTKRLILSHTNVFDLFIAADFLLMESITRECSSYAFANIDIQTGLKFLNVAWNLKLMQLFQFCCRFLQLNFQDVMENSLNEIEFMEIQPLKMLLAETNKNIRSENTIWNTIATWVEYDLQGRLIFVPTLLSYLNFENIEECMVTHIINHEIVRKSELCVNDSAFSENEAKSHYSLTLIVDICDYFKEGKTPKLYITFDEKLDAYQKLCDLESCPGRSLLFGHKLHFYDKRGVGFVWNLLENARMPDEETFIYRLFRYKREAALPNGTMYFIETDGGNKNSVERYEPESDKWTLVKPMPHMFLDSVISLNDKIYALGVVFSYNAFEDEVDQTLLAQMYNPETDEWHEISPPTVNFISIFQYKNKILVTDWKDVEEYDSVTNTWALKPPIPYSYKWPQFSFLNDYLYIYDISRQSEIDISLKPPVFWDEVHQTWEIVQPTSPFFKLGRYLFFPINNSETVKQIIRHRRSSVQNWKKSPFV